MPAEQEQERVTAWVGVLNGETATEQAAARFAPALSAGDVVALEGDLGAGKTVFARSLIRTLHAGEEVPSPTFNLVLTYEPEDPALPTIWHFDLYRLEMPEDAFELGIEEAFGDAISLVEWPDRLGPLLPASHIEVTLLTGAHEHQRLIEVQAPESMAARVAPALEAMGLKPVDAGEQNL